MKTRRLLLLAACAALAAAPGFTQPGPRPSLKQRLMEGQTGTGAFLGMLAGGPAAQFLAAQGMDFFIVDLEHYVFDDLLIREMIIGARQAGIAPIIRVAEPNQAVTRWLDAGAEGIIIPSVETTAQAAALVRYGRYPPAGQRGASTMNGHTNFARVTEPGKFLEQRNQDVLLMVMIESPKGMANLDAILSVPGIDGAILGTGDYSQAIGLPGQADHARVWEAADKFIAGCRARGKLFSIPIRRPEHVARWVGAGVKMLTFVDLSMIAQGVQLNLDAVRKARGDQPAR